MIDSGESGVVLTGGEAALLDQASHSSTRTGSGAVRCVENATFATGGGALVRVIDVVVNGSRRCLTHVVVESGVRHDRWCRVPIGEFVPVGRRGHVPPMGSLDATHMICARGPRWYPAVAERRRRSWWTTAVRCETGDVVGRVAGFVADPWDGSIEYLLVRELHGPCPRETAVPIADVVWLATSGVDLRVRFDSIVWLSLPLRRDGVPEVADVAHDAPAR